MGEYATPGFLGRCDDKPARIVREDADPLIR
jgi:hypothetical protein